VLIKESCSELLPQYLRFVKGVVDCEDLPLNISRETYQDSSLMSKLRSVITRRVIKLLEDEAKRDPDSYLKWYSKFQNYIKEGTQMDPDNKDPLFKLLRFHADFTETASKMVSLDEYINSMKEGQTKLYYGFGNSREQVLSSPFYSSL
jgi:TNF receptor-associated protein 1